MSLEEHLLISFRDGKEAPDHFTVSTILPKGNGESIPRALPESSQVHVAI